MKKILTRIFLSLLLPFILFSCKKKTSAEKLIYEVRLASNPFIGNAPFYVAIDKGFLPKKAFIFQ